MANGQMILTACGALAIVMFALGRWLTRWEVMFIPPHAGVGVRSMEKHDE